LVAELFAAAAGLWAVAVALGISGRLSVLSRVLLAIGGVLALAAAAASLSAGSGSQEWPLSLAGERVRFALAPQAAWLLFFGLAPAVLACALGSPAARRSGTWIAGAGFSLLGGLGVFGLQDGLSFLIAWEAMSLGGAMMVLADDRSGGAGRPVLFMLALLETGAVALVVAFVVLSSGAGGLSFTGFAHAAAGLSGSGRLAVAALLVIGFGAKLGLLPFYEWFPGTYGAASGATGALMSGITLNAAFFALSRALVAWLPPAAGGPPSALGVALIALGVVSAILTILYAFQQEDWRQLLSFSSAENAAVAVTMLGACLVFRASHLQALAGLAWTVALLHLAAHALAKGALFLAADGTFAATESYALAQHGLLRTNGAGYGLGAVFAAMSLAALPPQAGFVSEWFVFQTVFQGFHLPGLTGRLTLALAGAGLALTAAVAFATMVKVLGIGLLGAPRGAAAGVPRRTRAAVALLGAGVLALAVGMPLWLPALGPAGRTLLGVDAAGAMVSGWLLVPLSANFAFISPSLLIIVVPLLALLPLALLLLSGGARVRRAAVWYGGMREPPPRVATTALAFSNALRTFYSFVYRPTADTAREHEGLPYFVRRLRFRHDVAPIFGPYLFAPLERLVWAVAGRLRLLQSGDLNLYLAVIGVLLVIILAVTLA
jgi:formate hydrogenlyase subunit 3/multisubunit Na+/H+ antiporter MnhD subunit